MKTFSPLNALILHHSRSRAKKFYRKMTLFRRFKPLRERVCNFLPEIRRRQIYRAVGNKSGNFSYGNLALAFLPRRIYLNRVKRFFAAIMMLVMLTPSLVCAMPVCTDEALAAKAQIPCADHASHHSDKKETPPGKLTLMSVCMGVDMQKADTTISLDKPDIKKGFAAYSLMADAAADLFVPADAAVIRGPPPDWPLFSQAQPSILLTTQRFRI